MQTKLILCPLRLELEHLKSAFQSQEYECEKININRHIGYRIRDLDVLLAEGGHGKVQFGITTQKLISEMKSLDLVICAGAAGGLCPSVSIFDVVVASETLEHDYIMKFEPNFPKPVVRGHSKVIDDLLTYKTTSFKLHLGRLASGDEDIVDTKRAEQLKQETSALAVAWEGIGGAKACRFNDIPFVEVRAVTDDARHDAAQSFEKNLPIAMGNLGQVLHQLLDQRLGEF